jgi:hypothetical protein
MPHSECVFNLMKGKGNPMIMYFNQNYFSGAGTVHPSGAPEFTPGF